MSLLLCIALIGPVDASLRDNLDTSGLIYTVNPTSGQFQVKINFTDTKRHQVVCVGSFNEPIYDKSPSRIRRIWSFGLKNPTSDQMQDMMLRSNRVKVGAWELNRESDGTIAAFFQIKVPADCSPEDLKWYINVAAFQADEVEKATGVDEF